MPRKCYATPEALLRAVITTLEQDRPRRRPAAPAHRPLCPETLQRKRDAPAVQEWDDGPQSLAALCGSSLLAFLREAVQLRSGLSALRALRADLAAGREQAVSPIPVRGLVTFRALVTERGAVRLVAEGNVEGVAVLQLVQLLEAVGIANVRQCQASPCLRLYVKTYRRQYCSPRCQKRAQMRQFRQRARDQQQRDRDQQQQEQRRQRRKASGGSWVN